MSVAGRPTDAAKRLSALESRRGSLATTAYTEIRDEILRGTFTMGDILSRRRLAELLNMSFVPITEALQRLEAEGLVESRPRIGTRVRIPTAEDIRGTYLVCEALEVQSARLCAANMTASEKRQLRKSAEHLDQLYQAGQSEGDAPFLFSVHTYHMQFHMRIAEIAGCAKLSEAIEKERVLVFNWLYGGSNRRTVSQPNSHSKLAAAICSGSILRADEAMRNHIHQGFEKVSEHFFNLELSDAWRTHNAAS